MLALLANPLARAIALALAILALLGGVYWKGESHARREDAASATVAERDSVRSESRAGAVYDGDGLAARLRTGRF